MRICKGILKIWYGPYNVIIKAQFNFVTRFTYNYYDNTVCEPNIILCCQKCYRTMLILVVLTAFLNSALLWTSSKGI